MYLHAELPQGTKVSTVMTAERLEITCQGVMERGSGLMERGPMFKSPGLLQVLSHQTMETLQG